MFKKNMALLVYILFKLETAKYVVKQMSKEPGFRRPLNI